VQPVSQGKAVPGLRRLVAGRSPRRPGFDAESVYVRFVVDKVALGQVFPRVLRFSPVSFIPLVLHYTEKRKKLIIFITGVGRDSVVGIATRYGLDGPGIESRWGRDFSQPSRPALGPTQPPIQWVLGLFPGGEAAGEWS
jgi:hypothetical protein